MNWKCYQCDHVNNANELECDVCGSVRNLYAEEVFELKEYVSKQKEQLSSSEGLLLLANATLKDKQKAFLDLEIKHLEIIKDYELQKRINIELNNNISDIRTENIKQISLLQNEISNIKNGNNKNNGWIYTLIITTFLLIIAVLFIYNNFKVKESNLQRTISSLRKTQNNLQKTNDDLQHEVTKLKVKAPPLTNNGTSSKVIDFTTNIKSFLSAEESREFDLIYTFLSPEISRYYDLKSPSKSELRNRYEYLWSITSNSKNTIQKILKINDFTYDLQTEFEYYSFKKKMVITVLSEVRFLFDVNGKIIETYGIKD